MKHALLAVSLLAFAGLPKAFADDSQKSLEQQLAETEARMKELQSKISPIQSQLDELKKKKEDLETQKYRTERAVKLEARRQELKGWLARFGVQGLEVVDAKSGIMCSCEDWNLAQGGKPIIHIAAHTRNDQKDSLFGEMFTKSEFTNAVAQQLAEKKIAFHLDRDPSDPALTIGGDPAAKALFEKWGGKVDGSVLVGAFGNVMVLDGVQSVAFKTKTAHLQNSGEAVDVVIIVLDYPTSAPKSYVWYKSPTSSAEGFQPVE